MTTVSGITLPVIGCSMRPNNKAMRDRPIAAES